MECPVCRTTETSAGGLQQTLLQTEDALKTTSRILKATEDRYMSFEGFQLVGRTCPQQASGGVACGCCTLQIVQNLRVWILHILASTFAEGWQTRHSRQTFADLKSRVLCNFSSRIEQAGSQRTRVPTAAQ